MPTNRKAVIALSGKRFVGKDALASAMMREAERSGIRARRRALADDCKHAFAASMTAQGTPVDAMRLIADRAYKESWRPLLTRFTEEQLARDPQVFCRRIVGESHDDVVLLTDVRLLSEVAYLRDTSDVVLVRITRSDDARRASGWTYIEGIDDHRTETELDAFDASNEWNETVRNDGTLDQLEVIGASLLARFGARRSDR